MTQMINNNSELRTQCKTDDDNPLMRSISSSGNGLSLRKSNVKEVRPEKTPSGKTLSWLPLRLSHFKEERPEKTSSGKSLI